MGNDKFLNWCKQIVADYTNNHIDKTDSIVISAKDVFVVWSCKTLYTFNA